ncbi:hypothetical protein SNR37_003272 [Agarivorans aestuarii]|uniref:NlpE C-terminal OB domain-containing protein n=1 Tax=Agarivorans aestuarii TaxID=1563703 RepID=A0ABU7G3G1_9ALTE|nr:hypothetical protein [Agarivorans aestuarii]MEE1673845.1 hypothetical protein [Agarivorans aestuarii]
MIKLSAILVLVGGLLSLSACKEKPDVYSGHFVYGHEVREFIPCGRSALWWQADKEMVADLLEFYQSNITQPYQAIYVQTEAKLLPAATNGYAQDYPAVLRLDKILDWQLRVPPSCHVSPQQ